MTGSPDFAEHVGRSTGEHVAVDPVNVPMIRRWVEAMGDPNPVYLDDAAACATGRAGTIAPPAMLPVWTTGGLRATLAATAADDHAHRGVFRALAKAGFSVTPGVNLTHRYARELVPGDRLRATGTIAAVSERKDTALGPAHFVDLASEYRDDAGAIVGEQVLRVVAYDPASRRRPHAAAGDRAAAADDAAGREHLPPLSITLDRLGVIACTTACNDYRAGHYDAELARALGMRDIFTDIPTSAGLTARYVGEWAGPAARLLALDIALGVPFCAGDTLTFTGSVRSRALDGRCEVSVVGHTADGRHVRGTATVLLAA